MANLKDAMKAVINIIIFSTLARQVDLAPCNQSRVCTIRYDLKNEIHTLRGYEKCEDSYMQDCICQQPIDILYNESPPYIYTDPNTKQVVGIIPGILREALSTCCFSDNCTRINYLKPYKSSLEALKYAPVVTIITPFVTHTGAESALRSTFVGIIPTKGVVYVTSTDIALVYFWNFFKSVGSNWPLFCLSLLLALDAGIIVWLLDSWQNKKEFPRQFQTGIIEGLWWAFVSMTTVGYGDKTPKSLIARAFGIVWITVGISLCGVFTASLTTAMTQSFAPGELHLSGKTVGVMNKTRYELNIATREGAKVKVFSTYIELRDALKNREVEGILIDQLVLDYHLDDLEHEIKHYHARTSALKNSDTSYGLLFAYDRINNLTNREWGMFLKGFFDENKDNLGMLLHLATEDLPQHMHAAHSHEETGQKSLFNDPTILNLLFKYVGLATLVLLISAFLFDKSWLAIRYTIAMKQEKWVNKIEDDSAEDAKHQRNRYSCQPLLDAATISNLQVKFQTVMKSIEVEEGEDYSEITEAINQQVFHGRGASCTARETVLEMTELKQAENV